MRPDGMSIDPAFTDAFARLAPEQFSTLEAALRASAQFVDEEVVGVWRIEEGRGIARDFRRAADRPELADPIIREAFGTWISQFG